MKSAYKCYMNYILVFFHTNCGGVPLRAYKCKLCKLCKLCVYHGSCVRNRRNVSGRVEPRSPSTPEAEPKQFRTFGPRYTNTYSVVFLFVYIRVLIFTF